MKNRLRIDRDEVCPGMIERFEVACWKLANKWEFRNQVQACMSAAGVDLAGRH